jgi:hypothetical protein
MNFIQQLSLNCQINEKEEETKLEEHQLGCEKTEWNATHEDRHYECSVR